MAGILRQSGRHRVAARSSTRGAAAYTLVEVLVAMALALVVATTLYFAFGFLFARDAPSSLTNLTDRSFVNKDLRLAMRKLFYRLREGTQVVSPPPGQTHPELVFRDILNDLIRIRLLQDEQIVVSERFEGGTWNREVTPKTLVTAGGETIQPCFPIRITNCENVSFTAISPTCAVVHLTLSWRGNSNTIVTSVALRNSNLAY